MSFLRVRPRDLLLSGGAHPAAPGGGSVQREREQEVATAHRAVKPRVVRSYTTTRRISRFLYTLSARLPLILFACPLPNLATANRTLFFFHRRP